MAELASREFLTEFIELYRSFPCLWQVTCKEYSDRHKKVLAYAELVEKYREVEPKAVRSDVVKKISSLRTVYKKEVAKVKNSEKSGASSDDIYKPKLWYFPLLNFLSDQDTSRIGKSTMDDDEDGNLKEIYDDTNEKSSNFDDEDGPVSSVETPSDTSVSLHTPRPPTSKRKLNPVDKATTEALQLIGKKISSQKEDDSFDIYGKYVADRLRKINPNQIKFVQKLIADAMFEAEMESLNRHCRIVGHLDTGFQQVNSHQNVGQQPFPPQKSGFPELRGPGQQPFLPQTSGFAELRGPGQQPFLPQTSGFAELRGPGQQPFLPQTSGFAELRGPGQRPFPPQTSGFTELQDPGQQNFATQTFNYGSSAEEPRPNNSTQLVHEIAGSAKKYVENYDPNKMV